MRTCEVSSTLTSTGSGQFLTPYLWPINCQLVPETCRERNNSSHLWSRWDETRSLISRDEARGFDLKELKWNERHYWNYSQFMRWNQIKPVAHVNLNILPFEMLIKTIQTRLLNRKRYKRSISWRESGMLSECTTVKLILHIGSSLHHTF